MCIAPRRAHTHWAKVAGSPSAEAGGSGAAHLVDVGADDIEARGVPFPAHRPAGEEPVAHVHRVRGRAVNPRRAVLGGRGAGEPNCGHQREPRLLLASGRRGNGGRASLNLPEVGAQPLEAGISIGWEPEASAEVRHVMQAKGDGGSHRAAPCSA